jgi:integrase
MAKDHLWRRGDQYWLRLSVPLSLRKYFLSSTGKPKAELTEPLGDSKSVAAVRAAQRAAQCHAVFARLKAGEQMTPEQAAAAIRVEHDPDPDLFNTEAYWKWLHSPEAAKVDHELRIEKQARWFEEFGNQTGRWAKFTPPAAPAKELVTHAAEAWIADMTRDPNAAPRSTTIDGHRLRVRAFVEKIGDKPLAEVDRATASDFLRSLDVSNGTRNAYATTMRCIFEDARKRGRFTGDNPFDGQKVKKGGSSYVPFTIEELRVLFAKLPREIKPAKHTPETALPWAALIALYTGMRLEEIAQLTTADIREEAANGATVWCIDIHNGGNNKLKNETSARLVPVHSALVRGGLLEYVKALKAGPLFPGLKRRESKGGKVGARLGELFRKKLLAIGIKRDGLCFHSFRHTVAGRLDEAGVPQSDAARILGHAVSGMSYGTYSQGGPGLKRVAAVVEQIEYEGLRY